MDDIHSTICITKLAPDDAPGLRQFFLDAPSVLRVYSDEEELERMWDSLEMVLESYGGFVMMDRIAFRPNLLFDYRISRTDLDDPAIVLTFQNNFVYRQVYATDTDCETDFETLREVIQGFFEVNPEYRNPQTTQ
jgi:hypothetical protein